MIFQLPAWAEDFDLMPIRPVVGERTCRDGDTWVRNRVELTRINYFQTIIIDWTHRRQLLRWLVSEWDTRAYDRDSTSVTDLSVAEISDRVDWDRSHGIWRRDIFPLLAEQFSEWREER